MSKFKFMHTLSESKIIFAIEQRAIVSCFIKNVASLLGHPVFCLIQEQYEIWLLSRHPRCNDFCPLMIRGYGFKGKHWVCTAFVH